MVAVQRLHAQRKDCGVNKRGFKLRQADCSCISMLGLEQITSQVRGDLGYCELHQRSRIFRCVWRSSGNVGFGCLSADRAPKRDVEPGGVHCCSGVHDWRACL